MGGIATRLFIGTIIISFLILSCSHPLAMKIKKAILGLQKFTEYTLNEESESIIKPVPAPEYIDTINSSKSQPNKKKYEQNF